MFLNSCLGRPKHGSPLSHYCGCIQSTPTLDSSAERLVPNRICSDGAKARRGMEPLDNGRVKLSLSYSQNCLGPWILSPVFPFFHPGLFTTSPPSLCVPLCLCAAVKATDVWPGDPLAVTERCCRACPRVEEGVPLSKVTRVCPLQLEKLCTHQMAGREAIPTFA